MNILFLTMVKINSLQERGIYTDLLRKFSEEGHNVTVVCPVERREKKSTNLIEEGANSILKVKTFNLQKTNVIEKGIGTLAIEYQFLSAIKKHCKRMRFDIIIYSTPPITFSKVIEFIKQRDNAYAYLLLKDIFPQNAVDMKMLKENGFLHRFFLKKEKFLYKISDTIGCMSEANKSYLLNHNPEIPKSKVEVNPNSITPLEINQSNDEKIAIRKKYDLPIDKKILVYGGNLGIPQGLDFLLETIENANQENAFFLIVGSGTEYKRIEIWFENKLPKNAKLIAGLPKEDYDNLLNACDIGLIFLSKNFTIPNFPSRLLSYLEMKIPIIAATDNVTDIGKVIEENDCGKWVLTGDNSQMTKILDIMLSCGQNEFEEMRQNAFKLLVNEYLAEKSFHLIVNKIKNV